MYDQKLQHHKHPCIFDDIFSLWIGDAITWLVICHTSVIEIAIIFSYIYGWPNDLSYPANALQLV